MYWPKIEVAVPMWLMTVLKMYKNSWLTSAVFSKNVLKSSRLSEMLFFVYSSATENRPLVIQTQPAEALKQQNIPCEKEMNPNTSNALSMRYQFTF